MLTMMLLIAFASTMLEMLIVWKSPTLRKLVVRNVFIGLAFSVGIATFMSTLFGASGTIVAGAAFLSTLMSFAIYSLRLIELTELTIVGVKNCVVVVRSNFAKIGAGFRCTRNQWRKIRHPLAYKKLYS